MGRLRAAKKSRGHYVAKKGTDKQDSVSTIDLEAISLHTKKQSFITTTSESVSRERPEMANAGYTFCLDFKGRETFGCTTFE